MILLAGLTVLSAATQLPGQSPDDSLSSILEQARRQRWEIRAATLTGTHHTGRVTEVTDSTIAIAQTRIRLLDLSTLERKRVNHSTTLAGALVGGLGGLVLGVGFAAWGCSNDDHCADSAFVVAGALTSAGAALGAIVGGTLGPPEWRLVWRRP